MVGAGLPRPLTGMWCAPPTHHLHSRGLSEQVTDPALVGLGRLVSSSYPWGCFAVRDWAGLGEGTGGRSRLGNRLEDRSGADRGGQYDLGPLAGIGRTLCT